MPRLLPVLAVLAALLCNSCGGTSKPPPRPDWAAVEAGLASGSREERSRALDLLFRAEDSRPGTLSGLAALPEGDLPGLRHYTAAALLLTIRDAAPSRPGREAWEPTRGTLDLLVAGLDDDRPLPMEGAMDWDLPVARFCLSTLEGLTGARPVPRPVNRLPPRAAVAQWRRWLEENRDFLFFDAERGVWQADATARRLGVRLTGS